MSEFHNPGPDGGCWDADQAEDLGQAHRTLRQQGGGVRAGQPAEFCNNIHSDCSLFHLRIE